MTGNRGGRWSRKILLCLAVAGVLPAYADESPDAGETPPLIVARTFQPTLIASTDYQGPEAVRVFVRDIRFIVRVESLTEDQLKPLVAKLIGQELGVDAIQQALAGIADHCAGQGHPARAILPQQSFQDGVVRIVVAPGRSYPPHTVGQEIRPAQKAATAREQRLVADVIAARYRVTRQEVERVVATAYQAGRESAIDPLLILAVIAIESSFNPSAISTVGAKGLMQVMPQFHMDKIAPHGDEQVLFDPKTNVLVGAKILHEYLRRFGETVAALQMYVGALNDPSFSYARRVLAERSAFQRIVAQLLRANAVS